MKDTLMNRIKLARHVVRKGHRWANTHTVKEGQDLRKMAAAGVNMSAFVYGGGLEDGIGCFDCDFGKVI